MKGHVMTNTVTTNTAAAIREELTGHTHYANPYEDRSSCDNCRSTCCDGCRRYSVDGFEEHFFTFAEAHAVATDMDKLISFESNTYYPPTAYNVKKGHLYARINVWRGRDGKPFGNIWVPCNPDSRLYTRKLIETLEGMRRFESCILSCKSEPGKWDSSCEVGRCCTGVNFYGCSKANFKVGSPEFIAVI